jgi:hypothetical protein
MRRCTILPVALGLAVLAASHAGSEPIRVSFRATVTSINLPALEAFFEVGEAFDGVLQLELDTPDSDPSPTFGSYEGASDFRFEIGDDAITAPTGFAEVGDGDAFGGGTADFFRGAVLCEPGSPCSHGDFGGFVPEALELVLVDTTDAAFASDALPSTLAIADFDEPHAVVSFGNGVTGGLVEARVDAVTTTVPEAAQPLLLGAGAAVLLAAPLAAALRRRRAPRAFRPRATPRGCG